MNNAVVTVSNYHLIDSWAITFGLNHKAVVRSILFFSVTRVSEKWNHIISEIM